MKPKSPEGTFVAANLVAYQADSIVSRVLHSGEKGSVTVFAFDAGQGLDEHAAPFTALITVLEGFAEVTVEGTAHELEAGESLLMKPLERHAVRAPERFKMLLSLWRA